MNNNNKKRGIENKLRRNWKSVAIGSNGTGGQTCSAEAAVP